MRRQHESRSRLTAGCRQVLGSGWRDGGASKKGWRVRMAPPEGQFDAYAGPRGTRRVPTRIPESSWPLQIVKRVERELCSRPKQGDWLFQSRQAHPWMYGEYGGTEGAEGETSLARTSLSSSLGTRAQRPGRHEDLVAYCDRIAGELQ